MTYNFDFAPERRGTGSYKWDTPEADDILPMWVADMDFPTAPEIIEALRRRVDHGVFGYTLVGPDYYSAVIDWFAENHGWTIQRDWFIYTSGVVPAISAIIKALTRPGDKVIVQTPAYNCFFSSIRNNGCLLASNPLVYADGRYSIDFENLEQLAKQPEARLLLLCNPHNPSGRVWTREELMKIARICIDNDLVVVSDEIHCELTFNGHRYTPFGSLGEEVRRHSVSCVSPSKAFNIAGLQIANIITANDSLRRRIDRAINDNEVCDVNPFGPVATIAAYRQGAEWLRQLKQYLWRNYLSLCDILTSEAPDIHVVPLEATYLAWLDISATGLSGDQLAHEILQQQRLMINPGSMYGPGGKNFLRVNLAAPNQTIKEAAHRIAKVLSHTSPLPQ